MNLVFCGQLETSTNHEDKEHTPTYSFFNHDHRTLLPEDIPLAVRSEDIVSRKSIAERGIDRIVVKK